MIKIRQKILCISLIFITFAVLVGTYIASGLSTQYEIQVAQVCPEDIYATRNITDNVTTQERKAAAKSGVEDVYTTDYSKVDASVAIVNSALSAIRDERSVSSSVAGSESFTEETSTQDNNPTYLPDRMYQSALKLSDNEFAILAENTPTIVQRVMTSGVTDVKKGVESFEASFNVLSHTNSELTDIASALCRGALCVNKEINVAETESRREAAANAVPPVTYMKNQVIARRGEIITEAQYAMLKEMGFVKGSIQIDVFHTTSVILLLITTISLAVLYYMLIGKKNFPDLLVMTAVISSILTIFGAFMLLFASKNDNVLFYFMPMVIIPAILALLLNGETASVVNTVTAVMAGIITGDPSTSLAIILAGSAAAYVFSQVKRRGHLLYATLVSSFFYAVSYSVIFIDTSKSIPDILLVFTYSFLGGIFGGILTTGTIPFWEGVFDVITPMKLGELSNPEHKLLKKLMLNAPGSYHHALTVANMAEAASNEIGANGALARVGAYYHDIGKIENPMFFKENQFGAENPHDELSPTESAKIILSHVTEGVKMANAYHLPKAVVDIIREHHGTTSVSYFLYKARRENANADPMLFTYPGPTPHTKEATIIMLADACEAAVRAMKEKGNVDAGEVIDQIISDRIKEGQLSASALTFSDLEKVKSSFVKTLDQYFHKRILYPQNKEQ